MDTIQQGENYPFTFTVTGESGLGCVISLLRYPGDTPAFTRTITADGTGLVFKGALTMSETSSLSVGDLGKQTWFIHGRLTDSDEDIREPIPFLLKERWVAQ